MNEVAPAGPSMTPPLPWTKPNSASETTRTSKLAVLAQMLESMSCSTWKRRCAGSPWTSTRCGNWPLFQTTRRSSFSSSLRRAAGRHAHGAQVVRVDLGVADDANARDRRHLVVGQFEQAALEVPGNAVVARGPGQPLLKKFLVAGSRGASCSDAAWRTSPGRSRRRWRAPRGGLRRAPNARGRQSISCRYAMIGANRVERVFQKSVVSIRCLTARSTSAPPASSLSAW